VRSRISVPEIQQRALSFVPDDLLTNIPEDNNEYSLFQGFQATIPEEPSTMKKPGKKHNARGQRLIGGELDDDEDSKLPPSMQRLKNQKHSMGHQLEMMGVRKRMCVAEIHEIDNKIANLNTMRKMVLDRLAGLEIEESELEQDLLSVDNEIEDLQEELEDAAALAPKEDSRPTTAGSEAVSETFMSESIYQKMGSPKTKGKARKPTRRQSMRILHEHLESGSKIKELPAHNDLITAMDFDAPWGTLVTASLDDTVRVWDLDAGRCIGMLEGHLSSVRCLQVEESIVATGSMDATIRLWDLSRAEYAPQDNRVNKHNGEEEDDGLAFENSADAPPAPPPTIMQDVPLFSLESHVDEITALHFKGDTLVSGSADKTLRQWDLVKGRCVQTLDVLWAAAQATATSTTNSEWRPTGRAMDASADFVGAIQVFDAALACGTADGMVRLWDLRSGQVHRSLVGHTGPVTALQFDDVHLVTGSADRSIRVSQRILQVAVTTTNLFQIWDLRTGSIYDAYAYDHPVTSMMFDSRRIVSAAGESVVKVYDKTDGRHWSCGPGVGADEDDNTSHSTIERVRIKDGYLVEGRKDGTVGVWSC